MDKLRETLILLATIISVGYLFFIDYSDLSRSSNSDSYFGMIAMLCVVAAMTMLQRLSNKKTS